MAVKATRGSLSGRIDVIHQRQNYLWSSVWCHCLALTGTFLCHMEQILIQCSLFENVPLSACEVNMYYKLQHYSTSQTANIKPKTVFY